MDELRKPEAFRRGAERENPYAEALRARYEAEREAVKIETAEALGALRREIGPAPSDEPRDYATHEAFLRTVAESGNSDDRSVIRDVWAQLRLVRTVIEPVFDPSLEAAVTDREGLREYRDFLVSHEAELLTFGQQVRTLRIGWEGISETAGYGEAYVAYVREAGVSSEERGFSELAFNRNDQEFTTDTTIREITESGEASESATAAEKVARETAKEKLSSLVEDAEIRDSVESLLEEISIIGSETLGDVQWLGLFKMLAKLAVRDGMRGFRRRRYRVWGKSQESPEANAEGKEGEKSEETAIRFETLEAFASLPDRILDALRSGTIATLSALDLEALLTKIGPAELEALGIDTNAIAPVAENAGTERTERIAESGKNGIPLPKESGIGNVG